MTNTLQTLETSTDALPRRWIEKLFDEMLLDFGKKFVDQWASADPDKLIMHWANELSGYTGAEIRQGLTAQKKLDWPPTLSIFKKLCRPDVDPTVAYYQAVAGCQARSRGEVGEWPHPSIFWAARSMTHDLLSLSYSQVKTRWEIALSEQIAKTEWDEIPKPMKQLAAPGKTDLSKEKAAILIKEFKARDVVKTETSPIDHLLWAKKIMKRHENKDRSIQSISLKFAREALGMKK